MRPIGLAALAVGCSIAGGAAAQSSPLQVYPVAGLYGLEQSACGRPAGADPQWDTAKIAVAFCPSLGMAQRQALGERFRQRVQSAFANVAQDLTAQAGSGETAEARLSKTVIASLHISRADLWTVQKPTTVDVYAPVSLSLLLTNALTGEVLFVDNMSSDLGDKPLLKERYLAQTGQVFPARLNDLLDALVTDAAKKFKPFAVTGKIRGKAGDRYVFDVGRRGGVRDGDTIGADARVVFSDADYSIIEPVLGSLSVGQTLSRQVAQPVEMLAKPSALIVIASAPAAASRSHLAAAFSDALGNTGALAITPVNASFAQLRQLAIGRAQLSSSLTDKRAIPDYFVRISVATLDPVERDTNIPNTVRRIYEAHAFVEVVDHSGRVVFATEGKNRIVDDVTENLNFSVDLRQDSVMSNAVISAAQALAADFHPAKLRLPVKPAGDEVEIVDLGGAMSLGLTATVLRRWPGLSGDVWGPIATIQVTSVGPGSARARSADPIPVAIRSGDQIAFDGASGVIQSRRRFAECLDAQRRPQIDRRGGVDQPLFQPIAVNSFAGAFAAPVQINGFDAELLPLLSQFAGVERLGAVHPSPPDVCFQPIHQVDLIGDNKAGGGRNFTAQSYSVAIGYALRSGDAKLGGSGLQQTLTATGVRPDASPEVRNNSLQLDLAAAASDLAKQAARGLKPPL